MAAIALNGGATAPVVKAGHVTYTIETYVDPWCPKDDYDPVTGKCNNPQGGYWTTSGSGSTGALITGRGIAASSRFYVNGVSAAVVGDRVNEVWQASPPVPSDTDRTRYINISPGKSGSGQGTIAGGNAKRVYLNGKLIAVQGSSVTTCLGNRTTISEGNSLINM
ncbi:hypothetical protein ABU162_03935 [Paenibacillus thiaminolyticus]|uniref:hypothetical protein n=1 Tax=Paenibacillus thiaminolyticus TaxID=49283 RepID=UPI0035A58ABB